MSNKLKACLIMVVCMLIFLWHTWWCLFVTSFEGAKVFAWWFWVSGCIFVAGWILCSELWEMKGL